MAPFLGALIFTVIAQIVVLARQLGYASETIELIRQGRPDLVKWLTPMNTYLVLNAANNYWDGLQQAPHPVPKYDRLVHLGFIPVFTAAGLGAALGFGFDQLLSLLPHS